jgi:hypothetical protein
MILAQIIIIWVHKELTPWHTHQISIFDWYYDFGVHRWALWYHCWCSVLIQCIHLYTISTFVVTWDTQGLLLL